MKKYSLIFLIFSLFVSCNSYEPYPQYQYDYDPTYTWGYAEYYGAYYKTYNNPNNVLSLSLFAGTASDSLYIDSTGSLSGYGEYLYIEDLFIPPGDIMIPDGTYSVDSTGAPFTFYSGQKYKVDNVSYTVGAYVYFIEKNSDYSKLEYIDRGSFTVTNDSTTQKISCDFVFADSLHMKGTFDAALPYYDKSINTFSAAPRQKLRLAHPF